MKKNIFLFILTILFALVSILHFLRLALELDILVGAKNIPGWYSALIVVFAGFMSYWSYKLNRKESRD